MTKILVYFRGRVLENRGTPLRCRNLALWLSREASADVVLVSRDAPAEMADTLPELEHAPLRDGGEPAQLAALAARLQPRVIYAQTHKSAWDLGAIGRSVDALKVADLHGDLPAWRLEQTWRPLPWRLRWWLAGRLAERRRFPALDAFTIVSRTLEERWGALGKPMLRLWGGVDPELFQATPPPEGPLVRVAYAGNFRSYQGVATLVEAMRRLLEAGRPLHLTLIGDLEPHPELARRFKAALGDRLDLTGLVPYSSVPELLSRANVLVIPRSSSRTADSTYPSKLSEYLALGRPVVVTRVGDAAQVVRQGENGLLVPPESPTDMADALSALSDPGLRSSLGVAARETAESRLAWKVVAGRLLDFFERAGGPADD